MWWPSFCAVIVDLWHFALGRQAVASSAGALLVPDVQLSLRPSFVLPEVPVQPVVQVHTLNEHVRYDETHETTIAIREHLEHELVVMTGTADLTASEWLLYYFSNTGKKLPWSALTVTPPGQWHETLKGKRHVTVSVAPRTSALMEWQDGTNGYLAQVDGVSPEETITARILGTPLPGVLTAVTYTKEQWRELRPVFITIE